MYEFNVEITETLSRTVVVVANDEIEALEKIRNDYDNGMQVLGADDFMDVEFNIVQ